MRLRLCSYCCLFWILVGINALSAQSAAEVDSIFSHIDEIKSDTQRMRVLLEIRNQAYQLSDYKWISFSERLLQEAQASQVDSNLLEAYLSLGTSHSQAAHYPVAMDYYFKALSLARKLGLYRKQIDALRGIAYQYRLTGEINKDPREWAKAMPFVEEALQLARQHKIADREASALSTLAILYDLQKKHELAVRTFREIIALNERLHMMDELSYSWINLGICLKNNGRLEESMAAYTRALELIDSLGLKQERIYTRNNMAILYYAMGKWDLCEKTALETIRSAREMGLKPLLVDMYDLLQKLYSKQKRFEAALLYTQQLHSLRDSLFNEEKSLQMKDMQEKYDSEVKDQKIELQKSELAFGEKRSLYLAGGLGLVTLLGLILYGNQRRTLRLNRQISGQQEELLRQKNELQQVNQVKDKLFGVISHDLRSPVNSLISFSMLLENSEVPADKLGTYIAEFKKNLHSTAELMDNLLQFARSQLGGYQLHIQAVSVRAVALDTMALLEPAAAAKGLQIGADIRSDAAVAADIQMLAMILRNLLSNAIKYSQAGGEVKLIAEEREGRMLITVQDNGIGMEAGQLALFNQDTGNAQPMESRPGTAREKGSGLGLLLCKNFAGLMQARLHAESKAGEGSSFTLQLPLAGA